MNMISTLPQPILRDQSAVASKFKIYLNFPFTSIYSLDLLDIFQQFAQHPGFLSRFRHNWV